MKTSDQVLNAAFVVKCEPQSTLVITTSTDIP
jgi:hypothetical protein